MSSSGLYIVFNPFNHLSNALTGLLFGRNLPERYSRPPHPMHSIWSSWAPRFPFLNAFVCRFPVLFRFISTWPSKFTCVCVCTLVVSSWTSWRTLVWTFCHSHKHCQCVSYPFQATTPPPSPTATILRQTTPSAKFRLYPLVFPLHSYERTFLCPLSARSTSTREQARALAITARPSTLVKGHRLLCECVCVCEVVTLENGCSCLFLNQYFFMFIGGHTFNHFDHF